MDVDTGSELSRSATDVDSDDAETVPDLFQCPVCLDLLYKPIVLACGHVSCFWCVHMSMNARRESHCPICRHSYYHFSAICLMLHILIQKMFPTAYKRREKEVLDIEKSRSCFSPSLDGLLTSTKCEKLNPASDPGESSATCSQNYSASNYSSDKSESREDPCQENGKTNPKEVRAGDFEICRPVVGGNESQPKRSAGRCQQVSVADLLCSACNLMLFRPVVLNCGHVYCEACVNMAADGRLRCQVCQFSHPGGFPKVCLVLDQFLEEHFASEYALRKVDSELRQSQLQQQNPTIGYTENATQSMSFPFPTDENFLQWVANHGSRFHSEVGCDSCGMYPIIGERYKCKDCTEWIGFDLCGNCYGSSSKHLGKFNQQHTPEHRMEKVEVMDVLISLFGDNVNYIPVTLNQQTYRREESTAPGSQETLVPSNNMENDSASPVSPEGPVEDQSDDEYLF